MSYIIPDDRTFKLENFIFFFFFTILVLNYDNINKAVVNQNLVYRIWGF